VILEFVGYALSRFAGVWVGLKTAKDTVSDQRHHDSDPDRVSNCAAKFNMP
jgi:indolepyruvate ferredoxin oxidoreductase